MSETQVVCSSRCPGEFVSTYRHDFRCPREREERPPAAGSPQGHTHLPSHHPPVPQLVHAPSPFARRMPRPCLRKRLANPAGPRPAQEAGVELLQDQDSMAPPRQVDKATQVRPARLDKATQLYRGQVERTTMHCSSQSNDE